MLFVHLNPYVYDPVSFERYRIKEGTAIYYVQAVYPASVIFCRLCSVVFFTFLFVISTKQVSLNSVNSNSNVVPKNVLL